MAEKGSTMKYPNNDAKPIQVLGALLQWAESNYG